jgi:hypothetical protein
MTGEGRLAPACSVFLMFAGVAIVGAVAATRMLETGNRRLEDIGA